MRERHTALIVGAGPTGLVMAHQLARDGIQCRLIDLSKRRNALRFSGPVLAVAPGGAAPCQADRGEARGLLAALYDRFTEGFGTHHLKEAKAVLDELG